MKGRKPTPTAIKKLNGNPGKRALNKKEPDYPELGPTPPDFLDEFGQKEWKRVFPMLAAIKVIKAPEAALLAAYCGAFSDFYRLSEMSKGKGFIVKAPNGCPMMSPLFTALSKARTEMIKLMAELGITPSSRSRIKTEEPDEPDELDEFL
jgi:P27 family predicted phage terminase small subunit